MTQAESPHVHDDDADDELGGLGLVIPARWKGSLQKNLDRIVRPGTRDVKPIDLRLLLATKIDPSRGNGQPVHTRKVLRNAMGIDYSKTFLPVGHR